MSGRRSEGARRRETDAIAFEMLRGIRRRSRDDWIKANARKYLDQYPRELQLTWARETKRGPRAGLPQTLEESIASFIERLRGQIELREALGGKGELKSLKNTFNEGRDHDTGLLFDIDMEFFVSHAGNLVRKYY